MEFRKEEDKEETAWGSDLHLYSHPAHISHCRPGSVNNSDRERAGLGTAAPSSANHSSSNTSNNKGNKLQLLYIPLPIGVTACDISSKRRVSSTKASSTQWTLYSAHKEKTLQGDDIHLHCCLVSKVRKQPGILQLRRQHKLLLAKNRCLKEKLAFHNRSFFLMEINKRNGIIADQYEQRHLKIPTHDFTFFWFSNPPKHFCQCHLCVRAKGEIEMNPNFSAAVYKKNLKSRKNNKLTKAYPQTYRTYCTPTDVYTSKHTHKFRYRILAADSVNTLLIPDYCNLPPINAPQR